MPRVLAAAEGSQGRYNQAQESSCLVCEGRGIWLWQAISLFNGCRSTADWVCWGTSCCSQPGSALLRFQYSICTWLCTAVPCSASHTHALTLQHYPLTQQLFYYLSKNVHVSSFCCHRGSSCQLLSWTASQQPPHNRCMPRCCCNVKPRVLVLRPVTSDQLQLSTVCLPHQHGRAELRYAVRPA